MALLMLAAGRIPATASPLFAAADPPGLACRHAIAAAEQAHALPAHLLAAIGHVESGRRDPITGATNPWPWTIDAGGQGQFFDTKEQAIAAVRALQAKGVRSIDVGCLQINLMHHPNAFASLDQAFDPHANADYAGRFLRELYTGSGTWPKAAGLYHSATPDLGEPYMKQVMAAWPEETRAQLAAAPSALATAWGATMPASASTPPVRHGPSAHIIPLGRGPDGIVPAGHDLAFYRGAPVLLLNRPMRPYFGG